MPCTRQPHRPTADEVFGQAPTYLDEPLFLSSPDTSPGGAAYRPFEDRLYYDASAGRWLLSPPEPAPAAADDPKPPTPIEEARAYALSVERERAGLGTRRG